MIYVDSTKRMNTSSGKQWIKTFNRVHQEILRYIIERDIDLLVDLGICWLCPPDEGYTPHPKIDVLSIAVNFDGLWGSISEDRHDFQFHFALELKYLLGLLLWIK